MGRMKERLNEKDIDLLKAKAEVETLKTQP